MFREEVHRVALAGKTWVYVSRSAEKHSQRNEGCIKHTSFMLYVKKILVINCSIHKDKEEIG